MTLKISPPESSARRLKMRLEFDGSNFCGWQLQDPSVEGDGKHLESVQGVIERALVTYHHRKPAERSVVQGCGRTDAGVHAREFYCHFDLLENEFSGSLESIEKLRHGLNCIFPAGLVATHLESATATFHALRDVQHKTYEYRILLRRAKPTLDVKYCWWIPRHGTEEFVDFESFERCLKSLEGTYDFHAFMAAHSDVKSTVRTIREATFALQPMGQDHQAGTFLKIRFCGEGFLKHQVRNMVGSLMDVAQRQMSVAHFQSLFQPQKGSLPVSRQQAGLCAPAQGLFLAQVVYPATGGG